MRYHITVFDEVYTHKLVEAASREALENGDYNVVEEWAGNAGECDQIITVEEAEEGN